MLIAQLKGKLTTTDWKRSEDLLTSAVLGTLKNSPDWVAAELLSRIQPLDGEMAPRLNPPLQWSFWPRFEIADGGPFIEPDVVIEDSRNLIVIEAKLYSTFGVSESNGNQLELEWKTGVLRAEAERKEFWLLALTNHAALPADELRIQLEPAEPDLSHVCWLSWLQVGHFLQEWGNCVLGGWRDDLFSVLNEMGLAPFHGFEMVYRLAGEAQSPDLGWADLLRQYGYRTPGFGFGMVMQLATELRLRDKCPWKPDYRVSSRFQHH